MVFEKVAKYFGFFWPQIPLEFPFFSHKTFCYFDDAFACVFSKLNVGVECNIVYAYIRTRLKLGGFEAEKMRKVTTETRAKPY